MMADLYRADLIKNINQPFLPSNFHIIPTTRLSNTELFRHTGKINHNLPYSELFDLLLDIPDASPAYPERQISQGPPKEFLGLSHGELFDTIGFDNHQNHESLKSIDNPSASTHLTPHRTSEDNPSSYAVIPGIESNPKSAWLTNDSTLGLQQDLVQLLQLSDANQVQHQTAPISFDTMQTSPQQQGYFAESHDPSHSYPSVLNTFRSPLVLSQPTSSKSLSTSISLMPHAFMVPYQQQTLQPKPISSYHPRLASSILSTGQSSLGSTTSPEHKTVVQKPMNLPGKRKRKRITDFTTVTAYEPQLKKRQKSTTNEKMTRHLHSFSIAQHPGKDKVSQKKNMRPCLRCKRNRKGVRLVFPPL
ncbi:hypothetical protein GMOD_00006015 [Pyrenophora seminiperda CCB06]|uniref:Uncharacterized protein n=1 Tax=Pyrenophora seminiperda CCB06 TaxID=1302712 RepID=A0A3M7M4F8_9PLEO|nr:hypothetical protein GMOD_00006015 [Pyrenophora seminiperda CCB06]